MRASLFLAAALLLCAPHASAQAPATVPPLKTWELRPEEPLIRIGSVGEVVWTSSEPIDKASSRSAWRPLLRRWNPQTGATVAIPLNLPHYASHAVATHDGIVLLTEADPPPSPGQVKPIPPRLRAVLLGTDGRLIQSAPFEGSSDVRPPVVLADQSVLILGGRQGDTRSKRVDRVWFERGQLRVEQLPDHPGAARGYATVALADGRLFLLGGSDSQWRGYLDARSAETWFLDPAAKTWSAGPPMIEPRAEFSVTRLPGGSVLAAGGFTPTADWNVGPSRNVERWTPQTNRFIAADPMPSGNAAHEAIWMPGQASPLLLIAGGYSVGISAYDPKRDQWHAVGASAKGSQTGSCAVVPFIKDGRAWLWRYNRSEPYPQPGPGDCAPGDEYWDLARLSLPTDDAPAAARANGAGVALQRSATAFVPARGDLPALVIAGAVGEAASESAAVDAIAKSGSVGPHPPLQHARRNPRAVRLADGVLVIGGLPDSRRQDPSVPEPLRAEWLPADGPPAESKWQPIEGQTFGSVALGAEVNGEGLALDAQGAVTRFHVGRNQDAALRMLNWSEPLPPLHRSRLAQPGNDETVAIRGLADHRIVVAGGSVQTEKIALLKADSNLSDAKDDYVGVGEYEPSRGYEIYDWAGKRWHESVPSRGAGGKVAILDDGRVLKIGRIVQNETRDKEGLVLTPYSEESVLEISTADGSAWRSLTPALPVAVRMQRGLTPFVEDGELFIAATGEVDTGGGSSILLWLNESAGRWETLWQASAGDNWRNHLGRYIARQLPNGKRLVLPVGAPS